MDRMYAYFEARGWPLNVYAARAHFRSKERVFNKHFNIIIAHYNDMCDKYGKGLGKRPARE